MVPKQRWRAQPSYFNAFVPAASSLPKTFFHFFEKSPLPAGLYIV
jgi:hypothetical protein